MVILFKEIVQCDICGAQIGFKEDHPVKNEQSIPWMVNKKFKVNVHVDLESQSGRVLSTSNDICDKCREKVIIKAFSEILTEYIKIDNCIEYSGKYKYIYYSGVQGEGQFDGIINQSGFSPSPVAQSICKEETIELLEKAQKNDTIEKIIQDAEKYLDEMEKKDL